MPQLIQVVIGWIVITRRSTLLPIRVFARRRSGVETWHGSEAAVRRRAEPSYGRLPRAAHTKACLALVGRVRLEANVDTRQARATISDHVAALVISPTSRRPLGPISWMPLRTAPDPAKTRQFQGSVSCSGRAWGHQALLDSAPFVDAAGRDQAAFDLERVPGISSSPWNICAARPLLRSV
jgi:hypothetical protein